MDPKVENEECGRSPLAESAQVHSSRGDLTDTFRNRGFGVHSPSRDHGREGYARRRVTGSQRGAVAGPCVKKRLRHSVLPGIVLGELRVLGGGQPLGRLRGAARRKVLALARAKAAAEARGSGDGGATGFQRRHLTHGYCGAALERRWSPQAVKVNACEGR
jgi:hypothetical protein